MTRSGGRPPTFADRRQRLDKMVYDSWVKDRWQPGPEFLDTATLARVCSLSLTQADQLMRGELMPDDDFPTVIIWGQRYVHRRALEDWIDDLPPAELPESVLRRYPKLRRIRRHRSWTPPEMDDLDE